MKYTVIQIWKRGSPPTLKLHVVPATEGQYGHATREEALAAYAERQRAKLKVMMAKVERTELVIARCTGAPESPLMWWN